MSIYVLLHVRLKGKKRNAVAYCQDILTFSDVVSQRV